MELEKLEVLLEVNTKNVQESINRVLPQINGLLKKIEKRHWSEWVKKSSRIWI